MFLSAAAILLVAAIGSQAAVIKGRGYTWLCPGSALNGDSLDMSFYSTDGTLFYCYYGWSPTNANYNEVCIYFSSDGSTNIGGVCPSSASLSAYECPSSDDNGIPLTSTDYDLEYTDETVNCFMCYYSGEYNGETGLQSQCVYDGIGGELLTNGPAGGIGGLNEACPASASL